MWEALDDEVVVLDLRNSQYIRINHTGARLWGLLERGASTRVLADSLIEEFGVSREGARADVGSFLTSLRRSGLLEPGG